MTELLGTSDLSGEPHIPGDAILESIAERVLWLSTAMIDHANRVRPNPSGLKVGGHQASSASMVTLMTALWLRHLQPNDRVSVKPHASPVLHALNYLLGRLDESYLTTLRQFGGLQSYPSRLKDPDAADYSTGSVGIGATAPVWGTIARRYVNEHFGGAGTGRQYSLIGDAELDEGACWEAVLDPMVSRLGEIVWIVDVNRQSLDRIVPDIAIHRLSGMFAAAGWQVLQVKYGRQLEQLFAQPGGAALKARIDAMPNPEYQRLLRLPGPELRMRLVHGSAEIAAALETISDDALQAALPKLGGHDFATLNEAFETIDDTRPTVIFAYTVKGFGLPTAGHPQNHSALLTAAQIRQLAGKSGVDPERPWARFGPDTLEAELCEEAAERLRGTPTPVVKPAAVPTDLGRTPKGVVNTQSALGRTLLDLNRDAPEIGQRIVTVSPDVASSTNLAGWVNKVGVWSPVEHVDWFADDQETILHWRERSTGQHIELGIAEVNLVSLLGELGATWSRWGEALLPIGVVYDPFVERALEPWSFGIYAGGQSILVGTPSGVSLAPEGGAHQSIKTPSIGVEQPGCLSYEPAFAIDTEWTLLAALGQLGRPGGQSAYLRLSTRPVEQALANIPSDPGGREQRRREVIAGGYVLIGQSRPVVTIAAMGAVTVEALAAADTLSGLGFPAEVVCITSPGLLFEAVRARRGNGAAPTWILDTLFPAGRSVPIVTVLDGHPHTLAFLSGINGVPATNLGVTAFGQSGAIDDIYRYHGIDATAIVEAALDLVD